MGQAETLLNTLAGAEDATYGEFVVIGEDRFLQVPDNLKKLGVAPDHDVNTVNFKAPRYSDGRDLSQMSIWVNYMRTDGYMDAAKCENVIVDPEDDTLMQFEWIITRNVTEIFGNLQALVCAKKCDSAGNEINHWNSEICMDFFVSEGMEVQETTIAQYPDIVEYLLLRMATVENKTTQAAMLGYVEQYLDKDPSVVIEKIEEVIAGYPVEQYVKDYLDNYVDIRTTTDRTLTGSYAGAYEMVELKGNSEQNTIKGSNLLPYPYVSGSKEVAGLSFNDHSDGTITLSGTPTDYAAMDLYSGELPASLHGNITFFLDGSGVNVEGVVLVIDANGEHSVVTDQATKYVTVNLDEFVNITAFRILLKRFQNNVACSGTVKPSLALGSEPMPFRRYVGGMDSPNPDYPQEIRSVAQNLEIKTVGKNIVEFTASTAEVNGVTFTVDSEAGTVTANGTATENTFFRVGSLRFVPGDYKFSGCTGGDKTKYLLYMQKANSSQGYIDLLDGEKNLTAGDSDLRHVLIAVYTGATVTNQVFKPMVSAEGGEFEPNVKTVANVALTEPLRGVGDIHDKILKKDGVWGVERHFKRTVLNTANLKIDDYPANYQNVTYYLIGAPEDSFGYGRYAWTPGISDKFRCKSIVDHDNADNIYTINSNAVKRSLWLGFPHGTTLEQAQATGEIEYIYQIEEPTWTEFDYDTQMALDALKVFDGTTHVYVEGVQPSVLSRYGTSHWGARAITNSAKIDTFERRFDKELGDINAVLDQLLGGA